MVVDGNFKADNITMRNPTGDVSLSDGEAMFVGSVRFQQYISTIKKQPKVISILLILLNTLSTANPPPVGTTKH
jgi:hypothetical protein